MKARSVAHVFAICGTASFTGAMVLIGLTFGAYWRSLPPAEFLDWFSHHSHLIGRAIPAFAVPSFLGLAASLWLAWNTPQRLLWAGALICLAGVGLITALLHLPMNSQFVAKAVPLDQVGAMLDRWHSWHAARVCLGLLGSILGVLAVPGDRNAVLRTA